jgi:ABC-2 type transport system ATP-binding protein
LVRDDRIVDDIDSAIQIRSVNKSFGSTRAVRDLNLDVPDGSLCGFLGPNGAGKSTTIRMIMSIIYPDSGSVRVLGGSAIKAKDRIGYLPEERGLYRKMRVGEFLMYIGRLKGMRGDTLRRRISNWLERVELPNVVNKRCHELSKGMQQKVQFLASIIHDPELLIFDEPFSGLDPVNATLLSSLIREMHEAGKTIIFSTHLLYQAELLCDRIFLINHGVKLLDDSLQNIRQRFDPRTVIVVPLNAEGSASSSEGAGSTRQSGDLTANMYLLPGVREVVPMAERRGFELHLNEDADPQLVMREVIANGPVQSVELRQVTLEEIFVRLVLRDEGEEAAKLVREELSYV